MHIRPRFSPDGPGNGGPGTEDKPEPGKEGKEGKKEEAAPPATSESVPYERFKEVNEGLKASAETNKKLEARIEELELKDADASDRLKAQLERAERERDESRAELTKSEEAKVRSDKRGWIRSAATAAKFHDPEDAVARIDVDGLETQAQAKAKVEDLAKSAKHLIKEETTEVPKVGKRILDNGQQVDLTPAQQASVLSGERREQEGKTILEVVKKAKDH